MNSPIAELTQDVDLGDVASLDATSYQSSSSALHVVWVNQHAALTGGAEHYIFNTVKLLRERGVRNTLLYDVDGEISNDFTNIFEQRYPLVEPRYQLSEIGGDVAYVHRIEGCEMTRKIAGSETPAIRFFHDHKLFCLREHKYTTLGRQTCTQPTGVNCYTCLGFLARSESWPGVKLNSLGRLQAEQKENRKFDAIAVGSEYMANQVAAHGFDSEQIHTLPLFSPPPTPSENIQRKSNQFLFAGGLLLGKGLDLLIDALAKMKSHANLVIAGSGHQESRFREQVSRLKLDDRIEFVGRLGSEQMSRMLQQSTCVVAPSRSPETFGLSGLEAHSYGAAVIAADVGGMGTWLDHEKTGLFFPSGDVSALADAMERIVDEPELAKRLGDNGQQSYWAKFTPARHLDALENMLRSVARKNAKL